MAEEYLRKSKHNEAFCKAIEGKFPGSFYDFKVVSLFYCAIHLLKYYCLHEFGIYVGNSHYEIKNNVSNKSYNKVITLPEGMWDAYFALYNSSKIARYEGIINPQSFEAAMREEYIDSIKHLARFKLYAKIEKPV